MTYNDINRIKEETTVYILTSPDSKERFLFYNDPFNIRHTPVIRRQCVINGNWRNMAELEGDTVAIQIGGILTTKEKGNLKYLEYTDKGYIKSKTTLANV